MNRWHEERELMLRRWRAEIAKHENLAYCSLAPVPPQEGDCHCYRGMGFLRKRTPYDCGNPRCGVCHGGKFYAPKARATSKRRAIQFDLEAA